MNLYEQVLQTLSNPIRLYIVDVDSDHGDVSMKNTVAVLARSQEDARDRVIEDLAKDDWEFDYGTVYTMGQDPEHPDLLTWHDQPPLYFRP